MKQLIMPKLSEKQYLVLLVIFGIITRLICIPFVQITDSDATSRVFIAEKWLENPQFITDGIWLPLHYYLNAIAIAIFDNRLYGPMIIHILLTSLTILPLFQFVKREYSLKGAWFSILFYLLCPIIFRNSFQALSGLPHAFFVAMALNLISKSIRQQNVTQSVFAGLFMTIAAGFRYESWLLIAIFTLIYLLFKHVKLAISFWLTSMIFPVFWMAGNYITHSDYLFGLTGAYNWNILAEGVNDTVKLGHLIERFIYFPFSWIFSISPFLIIPLTFISFKRWKTKLIPTSRLIWSIPFWILMIVFVYKSMNGTLLMQHRFTILLILFSAPFISILFENIKWTRLRAISYGVIFTSLIPLSFVWMKISYEKLFAFSDTLHYVFAHIREGSQNQFEAIPRITDQKFVKHSELINQNLRNEDGLLLDFTSWDNTYFIAINSTNQAKNIFLLDGTKNSHFDMDGLKTFFNKNPKGVLLLDRDSKFSEHCEIDSSMIYIDHSLNLKVTPIHDERKLIIYRYTLLN